MAPEDVQAIVDRIVPGLCMIQTATKKSEIRLGRKSILDSLPG